MTAATTHRVTKRPGATKSTAAGTRTKTSGTARNSTSPAHRAAAEVIDRHSISITLPDSFGAVRLPVDAQRLAFYGGIAALATFGLLEWPVAIVIGVGHLLSEDHHHKCLAELGEALGDA